MARGVGEASRKMMDFTQTLMGLLDGLEGSGTRAKQGTGAYEAWHESVSKPPAGRSCFQKGGGGWRSERKAAARLEMRLRSGVHPQSHGEHLVIVSTPSPFAA